jgi:hypothetical protein
VSVSVRVRVSVSESERGSVSESESMSVSVSESKYAHLLARNVRPRTSRSPTQRPISPILQRLVRVIALARTNWHSSAN